MFHLCQMTEIWNNFILLAHYCGLNAIWETKRDRGFLDPIRRGVQYQSNYVCCSEQNYA